MRNLPRRRIGAIGAALLLSMLAIGPRVALAGSGSAAIPRNAHANSYGPGWQCDNGHRQVGSSCVAIEAPAHSYPVDASFGRGWQCRYGYRAIEEACVAIKVPANGYLADDTDGRGWACKRGYRQVA